MSIVNKNNNNKNKYLVFDVLNRYPNILHGFTIRNKKNITYEEMCDDLGCTKKNICYIVNQLHSDKVKVIYNNEQITDIDGLITNQKNIPLFIRTADCNSIILFDPEKEVIANIHSGWKGTLQRIIEKGVKEMIDVFGSNPSDIIACFFPSIRMCHFEVDEDVYELFKNEFFNIEKYIKKGNYKEGKQKYYIDTTKINEEMLTNLNVKKENIYITEYCTMCNNDLFYSHRMNDKNRNLTVVDLKEK